MVATKYQKRLERIQFYRNLFPHSSIIFGFPENSMVSYPHEFYLFDKTFGCIAIFGGTIPSQN